MAINIDLNGTLDQEVVLPMARVGAFIELESSNVLLEGALIHLHHTM